jgi:hypothetical protein
MLCSEDVNRIVRSDYVRPDFAAIPYAVSVLYYEIRHAYPEPFARARAMRTAAEWYETLSLMAYTGVQRELLARRAGVMLGASYATEDDARGR